MPQCCGWGQQAPRPHPCSRPPPQYYDLPSVSLRSAIWHDMFTRVKGFKPDKVLGFNISTPLGDIIPQAEPGNEREYFYADR